MFGSIGAFSGVLTSAIQVDSATVFRALWLGPLALTGFVLLYLQVGYLETYRSRMDRHLPLSWGEVLLRTLRGRVPSRADWYDVDWMGRQDILALFAPEVDAELTARRQQMFLVLVGMGAWFTLPVVASVFSAVAG